MKAPLRAFLLPAWLLVLGTGCVLPDPATAEGHAARTDTAQITLSRPVRGALGRDCFILLYVDRDPGPGEVDFGCGRQTYNGHTGTDFAIPDEHAMKSGVAVLAAAGGTVLRVRDGMPDRRVEGTTDKADLEGKDCGNGVVIDHGNGWETIYCHLRKDSVEVRPGIRVETGTPLGLVGQSGLASFPHVHFGVHHQGRSVDPFVGPQVQPGCEVPRAPLWKEPLRYVPTGLIRAGFADETPKQAWLWEGRFRDARLPKSSAALVFWVHVYGILQGDVERVSLTDPHGKAAAAREHVFPSPKRTWMRFIGRNNSEATPIQPGRWLGEYRLVRDGRVLLDVKRDLMVD